MTKNTTNTMTLVNETLTKDEVMSLLDEMITRNGTIDNHVDILKGTFTAWSGEVYEGYIVRHHHEEDHVRHEDYYFMEVTLTEVPNPMGTSHLWEPTFHKLLPITEKYKPKAVFNGNLGQYIVDLAYRDKWDYVYEPMTKKEIEEGKKKDWWWYTHHTTKLVPLTYSDIYGHWSTPLTAEEERQRIKEKEEKEKSLIARFSTGELPPAEDDAWYCVLSGGYGTAGYDLECKVLKILKNRGINAYIDGERDSFGWVTRGILIDGKVMCLY